MPLPDFIIIGAMKAGTSTLHSNLQLHPDIGMSKFKEPSYFNYRFRFKDIQWYKNQFSSEKIINGESSPNYSKNHIFPGTAKRMYDTIPNVKLIYLLRDPLERIISHLHHNLYRGRFKYSNTENVVVEDSSYVLTSSYNYQIAEYLKYFKREQILFITTVELKNDLNSTLNKICQFLGAKEFNFEPHFKARNKSEDKYLIKYYDLMKKTLPQRLMKGYHWFFWFLRIKIKRPELSHKTKLLLYGKIQDDIERFGVITGIDIGNEEDLVKTQNDIFNVENQKIPIK